MDLCVGAVSRLVIEEAAKAQVPQIVASRRQVNMSGGYVGITQRELVELVRDYSNGTTRVVRDHGGPHQDGSMIDTTWLTELDEDVAAGFDALHLDVSKLAPGPAQIQALDLMLDRYAGDIEVEIGGERDSALTLDALLTFTLGKKVEPSYVVIDLGGYIHGDRQCGTPMRTSNAIKRVHEYHERGVLAKAHNMDWLGSRHQYDYIVDAANIAPEFGGVETDAWLHVMSCEDGNRLLTYAWTSLAWRRWFDTNKFEGSWFDRARCAVRYVMNDPDVIKLLSNYQDNVVRERIRDALIRW